MVVHEREILSNNGLVASSGAPRTLELFDASRFEAPKSPRPVSATVSVVLVTPDEARRWLREYSFDKNRKVNEDKVAEYAMAMELGRWDGLADAIYLVVCGRATHMINGQHRMLSVIRSNTSQYFTVITHIVDKISDLETLYRNTDQGLKRTMADTRLVHGVLKDSGLTPTQTNSLKAAASLILFGFKRDLSSRYILSPQDHMDITASWLPEYKVYLEYIDNSHKKFNKELLQRMRSSPCMAVALLTIRHTPQKASEFWPVVIENSGLERGDPRKTLADHLMLRSIPYGSSDLTGYAQKVAACWSAFSRGYALVMAKSRGDSAVPIAGTPFTADRTPIGTGLGIQELAARQKSILRTANR